MGPSGGPAGSAIVPNAVLASPVSTNTASGARRHQSSGSDASAVSTTAGASIPPASASPTASRPSEPANAATATAASICRSLRVIQPSVSLASSAGIVPGVDGRSTEGGTSRPSRGTFSGAPRTPTFAFMPNPTARR